MASRVELADLIGQPIHACSVNGGQQHLPGLGRVTARAGAPDGDGRGGPHRLRLGERFASQLARAHGHGVGHGVDGVVDGLGPARSTTLPALRQSIDQCQTTAHDAVAAFSRRLPRCWS